MVCAPTSCSSRKKVLFMVVVRHYTDHSVFPIMYGRLQGFSCCIVVICIEAWEENITRSSDVRSPPVTFDGPWIPIPSSFNKRFPFNYIRGCPGASGSPRSYFDRNYQYNPVDPFCMPTQLLIQTSTTSYITQGLVLLFSGECRGHQRQLFTSGWLQYCPLATMHANTTKMESPLKQGSKPPTRTPPNKRYR